MIWLRFSVFIIILVVVVYYGIRIVAFFFRHPVRVEKERLKMGNKIREKKADTEISEIYQKSGLEQPDDNDFGGFY